MINKERLLEEFCQLVRIDSPSRDERKVADNVIAKLTELGLEVSEDDVGSKIGGNCGNVFGYLRGDVADAPVVMLSAHLDSVEPCKGIEPVVSEGIVCSAGETVLGADDKAGIASILEALRVIKEQNIKHGDIQVVFTVSEESGLSGSHYVDKSLLKADFGYILDSGGAPGQIINAAPGQNNIRVTIRGKTAHAGVAPEEGVNAIIVAGKALAQLNQGRIDAETTANVGIIKGGQATNIVPDYVEISCEARSRDNQKLEKQTKYMVDVFSEVAAANGAKAEVQVTKMYEPYVLTADMPVVAMAWRAAEGMGLRPTLAGTGGGSDANFFNAFEVPSAVLGIGMAKVHTTDEYIKIEDLNNTAGLVLAIIREASLSTKK